MRRFFTDKQIAASRAEWEPQLRTYAESTTAVLGNARRLPIYDHAVARASEWLAQTIATRLHLPPDESLIIAGDEHLQVASTTVDVPSDSIFLFRSAWNHWCSSVFGGEAPWWQEISWVINCPDRMIDLAHPIDHSVQLTANQTYLCTEEVADRGFHTIVTLTDDKLVAVQSFGEWVTS